MIILLVLLIFLSVCYFIARYLVYFILDRNSAHKEGTDSLSKDPAEVKKALEILGGGTQWKEFFYANAEEKHITSFDGIDLCAYFLCGTTNKYAILCHGYTSYHAGMLGCAKHFYDMGYNVLLPDARAHGKSAGRYRGMGWHERIDLKQWIGEITSYDSKAEIILYGQSMGGATVVNASGESLPENVKLIISDCAYIGVWEEFSLQLKARYHLPAFPIMHFANIISKSKAGYTFREASPLSQIRKNNRPILLIHGEKDAFVPYEYLNILYNAANEPKYKLGIKDAGHCMSIAKDNELYWKTIDDFIEKYMTGH